MESHLYKVTIRTSKTYLISTIGSESALLKAQRRWRNEYPDTEIDCLECEKVENGGTCGYCGNDSDGKSGV